MKSRARDRDIGWRIDYFFVSDSFKANVTKATVLRDQLGSDHCPITVTLEA
jgi:exodeoxyribonuclease-3